jgi:SNF2 family DNA or RNA helicase
MYLASVNLTAANYVHIMEPQWNPMVEAQAVDRVHRIGQQQDVLITRYLIKDSIEFASAHSHTSVIQEGVSFG